MTAPDLVVTEEAVAKAIAAYMQAAGRSAATFEELWQEALTAALPALLAANWPAELRRRVAAITVEQSNEIFDDAAAGGWRDGKFTDEAYAQGLRDAILAVLEAE